MFSVITQFWRGKDGFSKVEKEVILGEPREDKEERRGGFEEGGGKRRKEGGRKEGGRREKGEGCLSRRRR